ncbi:MAG: HIT domain-containing protein [Verrucomicrobia bacterium]|jgi:histidine triad (HIT) family protein|nr:HIT domain-containing protein [Verrucomicrobiota bacterium]
MAETDERTLFQKIHDGEIPAEMLHRDDRAFAIRDINPQAPTHFLVIPVRPLARLEEAEEADADLLGHLLLVARKVAGELGLDKGFRVVINNGREAGETVPHLHVHVLGGRPMTWPPG